MTKLQTLSAIVQPHLKLPTSPKTWTVVQVLSSSNFEWPDNRKFSDPAYRIEKFGY